MSDHAAVYAEIALTSANQGGARHTYHYLIPEALLADGIGIDIGHLVEVGFATARAAGVVVALSETSPVIRAKPIYPGSIRIRSFRRCSWHWPTGCRKRRSPRWDCAWRC